MRLTCLLLLAATVALGCASRKPSDHVYAGAADLSASYAADWSAASERTGDAEAGKELFWGKDGKRACATCHSFNADDTMKSDGDGQIRAGVSLYAARHRPGMTQRSQGYARDGVKVVVPYWHDGPGAMFSAQGLADVDAYLASQAGDATHATASDVPYQSRTWTLPASTSGGNAERGKNLAYAYCGTCHEVDGRIPMYPGKLPRLTGGKVPEGKLLRLAHRIRNTDGKNNRNMPGFPDDRMPESDLLDLLAWFAE